MKREREEMRKERKQHSTENVLILNLKLILWMALLTGSIPILTDPYSTVWKQKFLTPTLELKVT